MTDPDNSSHGLTQPTRDTLMPSAYEDLRRLARAKLSRPLEFAIDVQAERATFLAGFYKGFARNWNANVVLGFGTRRSACAVIGYRF